VTHEEGHFYWGNGSVCYMAKGKLYLKRCDNCREENDSRLVAFGRAGGDKPAIEAIMSEKLIAKQFLEWR
jgi:hypothetical protein